MAPWKWPWPTNPRPQQHTFSKDYPPSQEEHVSLGRTTELDDTSTKGLVLHRTPCHNPEQTAKRSRHQAQDESRSSPPRSLLISNILEQATASNGPVLVFSPESGLGLAQKVERREEKARRKRHEQAREYYRDLSEIHRRKGDQGDTSYVARTLGEGIMNELKAYYAMERKRDLEAALALNRMIQDWMERCEYEGCVGWPGSRAMRDRELERAQGGLWAQDR